ncbi:MAG: SIR2 family protein [Archangium sp.]
MFIQSKNEHNSEMSDIEQAPNTAVGVSSSKPDAYIQLPGSSEFEDFRWLSPSAADKALRARVTEKLREALQLPNLIVLCGSGTSMGLPQGPSMWNLWEAVVQHPDNEPLIPDVESATGYKFGLPDRNIEELLSLCDAALQLPGEHKGLEAFRNRAIAVILDKCRPAGANVQSHEVFLKKITRRRSRDPRVKLFTTNYDRCFEKAAAHVGVTFIDGFSFGSPRRFDPRFFAYDLVERAALHESSFVASVIHYFKMHGSVDWSSNGSGIEIDSEVTAANACLIYPARKKYQQSYEQPHLEMMAQFLSALRQPNTCLLVLGFGFNDDHLCAPILAALRSNHHFRLIIGTRSAKEKIQESNSKHPWWPKLRAAAQFADTIFVDSTFDDFVKMIPSLDALSPADRLVQAVQSLPKAAP